MSDTPIWDFAQKYREADAARFHMPGHKGKTVLGPQALDITEIDGADSLYEAAGVIRESEAIASSLFGCSTFYSTEGSSLCIRAMLYMALCRGRGRRHILAGRNAHRVFLYGAAVLDMPVTWLLPERPQSYHSCVLTAQDVEKALCEAEETPCAVYLTSPDYLGNVTDIPPITAVCHRYGVPLIVDGAHGAYLHFEKESRFAMDGGADLCCSSAHKTLPALTGGAYLHTTQEFAPLAKQALALFGSTSPSYLILESLDLCNAALRQLPDQLEMLKERMQPLRQALLQHGWQLAGDEMSKLTLLTKPYGYTGQALCELLLQAGITPEFYDTDHMVLMISPMNTMSELDRLQTALCGVEHREAILDKAPQVRLPERVISPRRAMLLEQEEIPFENALGRVLGFTMVACPPAIPIIVSGERVDRHIIDLMCYYGIRTCKVICEDAL